MVRRTVLGTAFAMTVALALATAATSAQAFVEISSKATKNMNCGAGVCKPTANHSILNVTDLANLLAVSNIEVTTGHRDRGIEIDAPLSWTSGNQLSLITQDAITIKRPVSVLGTGSLAFSAPALLVGSGRVIFWDLNSHLRIGADAYTLVGSVQQLAAAVTQNPNGFYALANDYDATADGTYAASPVGNFDGIFDGLGNSISNLAIDDPSTTDVYLGLFSGLVTDNNVNAALRNLILKNIKVAATPSIQMVGGLVGMNSGTVANIRVSGAIAEGANTGGIVGYNSGRVTASSSGASVTVSDAYSSGGLVGQSSRGVVENSSSSGALSGAFSNAMGGLVGYNNYGSIAASHSSSTITSGGIAGGLAGSSQGPIALCYATGDITNASYAGGLVAFNSGAISQSFALGSISNGNGLGGGLVDSNSGTIVQSYARGDIANDETSGGFAGGNSGTISESFSTGHVSDGSSHGGFVGFEGYSKHELSTSYWDVDTSGYTKGAGNMNRVRGLKGLTTEQFLSALPVGFDPAVWGQNAAINNGYPYLLANPPP